MLSFTKVVAKICVNCKQDLHVDLAKKNWCVLAGASTDVSSSSTRSISAEKARSSSVCRIATPTPVAASPVHHTDDPSKRSPI